MEFLIFLLKGAIYARKNVHRSGYLSGVQMQNIFMQTDLLLRLGNNLRDGGIFQTYRDELSARSAQKAGRLRLCSRPSDARALRRACQKI